VSYNVDSVELISGAPFITPEALESLRKRIDEVPEDNVFDDFDTAHKGEPFWYPKRIAWTGEGSGYHYERLLEVLSAFSGECELVVCFEGGDSYQGLRLRNHVVTKHKVRFVLGDELS
jgi:hypothetical protein